MSHDTLHPKRLVCRMITWPLLSSWGQPGMAEYVGWYICSHGCVSWAFPMVMWHCGFAEGRRAQYSGMWVRAAHRRFLTQACGTHSPADSLTVTGAETRRCMNDRRPRSFRSAWKPAPLFRHWAARRYLSWSAFTFCDPVLYEIHPAHLQTCSPVFQTALCAQSIIHASDPVLSGSHTTLDRQYKPSTAFSHWLSLVMWSTDSAILIRPFDTPWHHQAGEHFYIHRKCFATLNKT